MMIDKFYFFNIAVNAKHGLVIFFFQFKKNIGMFCLSVPKHTMFIWFNSSDLTSSQTILYLNKDLGFKFKKKIGRIKNSSIDDL